MPRLVDHDQRRAELAQAVWGLIRDQGLAGVTIRALSDRSGWSSGAIRHYLPNREAILSFAAQQVNEQAEQRIRALPMTSDRRQNFINLLLVMLPLDAETQLWMDVWLAFVGAAASTPQFADTHGLLYSNLNRLFLSTFSDFQDRGWLATASAAEAATQLHAVLDGLSIHLMLRRITPAQARGALEATLDRLLVAPSP